MSFEKTEILFGTV